jgi:hypothetical protein
MIERIGRLAACAALCVGAGCAGGGPPAADAEAPPSGATSTYGITHHGLISGIVTDAGGTPLDSIEVVTWRLADPGGGSLPNHYRLTDLVGAATLPVELTAPSGTTPETLVVRVVVRGYAFSARYNCGGEPLVDSTVVPVRVGPDPEVTAAAPFRLVLPVRRC